VAREEEAMTAALEAVDICRELARAGPDAFRSALATALNNLSLRLSRLGWSEEALAAIQEAVDLYRERAVQ
jgi:hypothetical protein